jgi:site-specific recombinase XerD
MAGHFDASLAGFADWLPYSGRYKSEQTVTQYVTAARRLAIWARAQGRASFAELTRTDLRAFLNSLPGRGGQPASASSKSTVWWAIRSLYSYLAEEEQVPDIARTITVGRPQTSDRITHLDPHEVGRLLKACQGARELAIISVALDSGLRISELAGLQVADVMVGDLRSRRILVTGKGGKTRGVVIGSRTAMDLRKYLSWRARQPGAGLPDLWLGARGRLTVSGLDRLIRLAGTRAGLEIYPHLLRHTWAHMYRVNGGQTDNLSYLAGWSGPAMALRYGASAAAERAEAEARNLSLVDRMRGRS